MSTSYLNKLNGVRVTIVSAAGKCPLDYKVGDSWLMEDAGKTPDGMCALAYHELFQYITLLRFDGKHPWDTEKGVALLACPDVKARLVFELRAVKQV
jgi:uncharacterized repeat protein (TIGR04076 family)